MFRGRFHISGPHTGGQLTFWIVRGLLLSVKVPF